MNHNQVTGMKSFKATKNSISAGAPQVTRDHSSSSSSLSTPRPAATPRPAVMWLFVFIVFTAYGAVNPSQAKADGMAMLTITGAEGSVRATDQRALLWLRDGAWEVHINPIFDREEGAVAWVVPFPVLPQVSESNPVLFEDLELTTSPLFIHYCTPSSYGGADGGMGADASSGTGNENADVETNVKIWDQGEVGELEYVVLSTEQGEDLTFWLEENGYVLPQNGAELIAEFETEGQFFFVARIAETADPNMPISPVRFVLPEMQTPLYPLRLTGMGVQGNEKLSLTLWVAFSIAWYPEEYANEVGFIPKSHPFARLSDVPSDHPTDADSYNLIVEEYFEEQPSDQLLLQYGESMTGSLPDIGRRCTMYGYYLCIYGEELGIDYYRQWSPEILEMIAEENTLFRYEGSLNATALEKDLVFEPIEWLYENDISRFYDNNIFTVNLGTCPSDDSYDPDDPDDPGNPHYPQQDGGTIWEIDQDASFTPFRPGFSGDYCGCSVTKKTNRPFFLILVLLMAAILSLHLCKNRRS